MDEQRALQIVEGLAGGVNPITGEVLGSDSLLHHPEVVRALFFAARALGAKLPARKTKDRAPRERNPDLPANAGKAWLPEQDARLVSDFDEGKSVAELAVALQRSEVSIRSRLIKFGKIDADEGPRYAARDAARAVAKAEAATSSD